MGDSRLVFGGGFPFGFGRKFSNVRPLRTSQGFTSVSRGGIAETIEYGVWDEVEVEMDVFGTPTEIAAWGRLHEWWSSARRGEQYAVEFDSDEVANTTLDGTANFGQKVIPLTSTTGINVGSWYTVHAADLVNSAVVKVASISAGVSVTVTEDLLRAFVSGDTFRALYYWPKCVSIDREAPFWERKDPPRSYTFRHRFREDRG